MKRKHLNTEIAIQEYLAKYDAQDCKQFTRLDMILFAEFFNEWLSLNSNNKPFVIPAVMPTVCAVTPVCKIIIDKDSCNPKDCPYFEAH